MALAPPVHGLAAVAAPCARKRERAAVVLCTAAEQPASRAAAATRLPLLHIITCLVGLAVLASSIPAGRSVMAATQSLGVGLLHMYESAVLRRPVLVKAATSGVAYILGDALSQSLTSRRGARRFDASRTARSGVAGFISHGPQLHVWCLLLDRYVSVGTGVWAPRLTLLTKIALDQTFFSLYINGAYCAVVNVLARRSPKEVWRRVKSSSWPALRSSWRFWPAVHALTFSIVPMHLRVLWVDAVEVVWVAILATCVAASGSEPSAASGEEKDEVEEDTEIQSQDTEIQSQTHSAEPEGSDVAQQADQQALALAATN